MPSVTLSDCVGGVTSSLSATSCPIQAALPVAVAILLPVGPEATCV